MPVWRSTSIGLTHHERRESWGECLGGVIFICSLPQFNLANTGISPSCFYGWMLIPTINLHSATKLRGFLNGTLVLFYFTSKMSSRLYTVFCIPTMFVMSKNRKIEAADDRIQMCFPERASLKNTTAIPVESRCTKCEILGRYCWKIGLFLQYSVFS